jgi:hypothetical protein
MIIVKVQRSIPAGGPYLVYDEAHSFVTFLEPSLEMEERMGDDLKAFFEAEVGPESVEFGARVGDKEW